MSPLSVMVVVQTDCRVFPVLLDVSSVLLAYGKKYCKLSLLLGNVFKAAECHSGSELFSVTL